MKLGSIGKERDEQSLGNLFEAGKGDNKNV